MRVFGKRVYWLLVVVIAIFTVGIGMVYFFYGRYYPFSLGIKSSESIGEVDVNRFKMAQFFHDFGFLPYGKEHFLVKEAKNVEVRKIVFDFVDESQALDRYKIGNIEYGRFSQIYDEGTGTMTYRILIHKEKYNYIQEDKGNQPPDEVTKRKIKTDLINSAVYLTVAYQNLVDQGKDEIRDSDVFLLPRYEKVGDWITKNGNAFNVE